MGGGGKGPRLVPRRGTSLRYLAFNLPDLPTDWYLRHARGTGLIADKQVVRFFLPGYARWSGADFVSVVYPDEQVRDLPAVDAIATERSGRTVAVEHSILQPFPGQKESLHERLEKVFEPLKQKAVPGRNIMLTVPSDSVKRGQDWGRVAAEVDAWFERVRASFPYGWSFHTIPTDCEVHIWAECVSMNGNSGVVSIMYSRPKMDSEFVDVVTMALERKGRKLVSASADRGILLFQREWAAYSIPRLSEIISSLTSRFPDIQKVDEIWLADSWFYTRYGYINFDGVWPPTWASSPHFRSDTAGW